MSETTTKSEAPKVAPAAQPIATVKREAWETFRDELDKRADEIATQLPPNVTRDRFIGAALAAVKATPAILTATPRSLMSALTKAAQDGLLPDGREGIVTIYSTKGENIAQWNPMIYGMRKRAREIDGIIIDAQVVVEGDEFDFELGDQPRIHHKPAARGQDWTPATKGIAAYAIFRHPTEGILHREVMWGAEIRRTQAASKASDSLMWTGFWTEGWKKTVARRGSKSVPVSPQLERLIQRDDENFVFDRPAPAISKPATLPDVPDGDDEPPAGGGDPALHNSDLPEGGKSEAERQGVTLDMSPGTIPRPGVNMPAAPIAEADFVPTGEITPAIEAELRDFAYALNSIFDEGEIEQQFDAFDVQTRYAGNQVAIAKAFEIKVDAISALATFERADLEAAGQGDIFGGGLPEVPDDDDLPADTKAAVRNLGAG